MALAYARREVPVLPCEPDGKRPLTRNGFWDATTEARRIEARRGSWPAANVGVPTGWRSGLLVLDANGPLHWMARARTGAGGVHVFFAVPGGGDGPQQRGEDRGRA